MPKAVIVGGAGYIGSVTAHLFLEANWEVTILDDLSLGHRSAVSPKSRLAVLDIRDTKAVTELLADVVPDCVLHFAALAAVGESFRETSRYFDVNISGTLSLLRAVEAVKVRNFVFSSSCTVYGIPESVPINEDEPIKQPISPYGQTKMTGEQVLAWSTRNTPLSAICLRYFNAAGAWHELGEDHLPETHLIPLVIAASQGTRPPVGIFGTDYGTPDGTCIRDYIHVRDLARAHLAAAERLIQGAESSFDAINLGTGQGSSVLEVIQAVGRCAGNPVPTTTQPRREGDPPILVAANDKARDKLNWNPTHSSLDEIVQSAWEWHTTHPHGYQDRP